MVAVPSIGRASGITPRRSASEADATRELYERYARQIYSFCYRQLGSKEEAEDATQSTFLNAFRGYMRGVDPEYESAWIYKIAENVCLTRQRSSTRRRRVEAASDLDSMQDFVPAHQSDSDELIRLPEALDAMPEQQRRALLLREWQGLSYKEIAEELEVSQAAVETLLFRARRSLAAGLTDELQQPKKGIAKRMRAGGDLGSIVTLVKTILFTGGAKVAATVATVAATSVVAATPVARHAVEHVVAPTTTKPAKHLVTKQPSSARPVKTSHVAGAGAVAVVAHHANLGSRAPLPRAHRTVAKHPSVSHLVRTSAPVHTATVNHTGPTTSGATTASTPTPPAVSDPTPTAPSTSDTSPTTSDTPSTSPTTTPATTQSSGGGTTTKEKDKDNGNGNGNGNSSSGGASTTSSGSGTVTAPSGKPLSATPAPPAESQQTTTTTTAPSTPGNNGNGNGNGNSNGNGNGNANGQSQEKDKDKTTGNSSKSAAESPTTDATTVAPAVTQPAPAPSTTPAPPTTTESPTVTQISQSTVTKTTTPTAAVTPLPESGTGTKK